jgi:oligoendopeptidase F
MSKVTKPARSKKFAAAKRPKTQVLPKRSEVPVSDQWNLAPLYNSDAAWEADFDRWQNQIPTYATFQGKLANPADLATLFRFDADFDRLGEKLGSYAFLNAAGDQGASQYQRLKGRFEHMATKAAEAGAFIGPELLALPEETLQSLLNAPELAEWKLKLERIVRFRPHTLSHNEEQLLAMSQNMAAGSNQIFRQLTDTDLKWPIIQDERGIGVELGHSSFSKFLQSPKRSVRKNAFHAYYAEFEKHQHTLAASLNASVQRDVFYSKARKYPSTREASLFDDHVPPRVYDALLDAIHKYLPVNHRYLALRRRALKIPDVHMYDTYVPIVSGIKTHYTWEQAATTVCDALAPLGPDYGKTLRDGLTAARWADRYPNAGKASGAFSAGGFDGPPYLLMNYQPEVLDHLFTLAHEAGHSMHTWHSARHQPFQYYGYAIFVAEVASTFNEQLLLAHLLARAKNDQEKAYLINHAIDEIRGTIIRQTMFAEFEKITHDFVEKGEPLTIDLLRSEYRKLLELYFGVPPGTPISRSAPAGKQAAASRPGKISHFVIDPELDLECLRIPHFYRAFYVYKYATGLSAAIALSGRVLGGGPRELAAYLRFLTSGSSKWPLDLLRDAGVDMEQPAPVETALQRFAELVGQLDQLV